MDTCSPCERSLAPSSAYKCDEALTESSQTLPRPAISWVNNGELSDGPILLLQPSGIFPAVVSGPVRRLMQRHGAKWRRILLCHPTHYSRRAARAAFGTGEETGCISLNCTSIACPSRGLIIVRLSPRIWHRRRNWGASRRQRRSLRISAEISAVDSPFSVRDILTGPGDGI